MSEQRRPAGLEEPTGHRQLTAHVESVGEILRDRKLDIPAYQRPYTWSRKNVTQLVDDIRRFSSAGQYRIGTFILNRPNHGEASNRSVDDHPEERHHRLDIVDGQQRYLTFALISVALLTRSSELDAHLAEELEAAVDRVTLPHRRDDRSSKNLRANYAHLERIVSRWDTVALNDFAEFFLKECTVVVLDVRDLDAAFQMFDSQNTRGKPLFPTDLLKAYHLREFSRMDPNRESVLETVREWEEVPPEEINQLISGVLFPIKQWSDNRPLPHGGFTSHHVDLFKGIREDTHGNGQFRWAHPVLLAKSSVDRFRSENRTLLNHGVIEELEFPFQITQPVIDGAMFFRMVRHYVGQTRRAGINRGTTPRTSDNDDRRDQHDPRLSHIHKILNAMPPGTGNRYVRELFDCLLIAYLDRFGWHEVDHAALRLARYAYLLRVHLQRVQVGSVDIHARRGHDRVRSATSEALPDMNVFAEISRSFDPRFLLDLPSHIEEIDQLADSLRALYATDRATQQKGHRDDRPNTP